MPPGKRRRFLKLLIQPHDGIAPLLAGIKSAKKSIDILIFRMDWKELETALKTASGQGIAVRALIAHTNRGGESKLRALETRFLEAGITVGRTADDLIRYHGKMMIIDRRTLFLLSFNFVHMDIDHSRGFGIVTKSAKVVQEAVKLFEADLNRKTYKAGLNAFVVSPANARKQLSTFIKQARKQLLIYDPKIADKEILRLLEEHAKAGLDIKIIGSTCGSQREPAGCAAHQHAFAYANHYPGRPPGFRGQPEPATTGVGFAARNRNHRSGCEGGECVARYLRKRLGIDRL